MKNPALWLVVCAAGLGLITGCGGRSSEQRLVKPAPAPAATSAAPPTPAAASASPGTSAAAPADAPSKTAPLHGGVVASAADERFETVVKDGRILVYGYTAAGAPATMHSAAGQVTLRLPDGTSKEVGLVRESPAPGEPAIYFCPMHASVVRTQPGQCELCGGMKLYTQDRLAADLGVAVPAKGVEASIRIGDDPAKQVEFAQTLAAGDPAAPAGTAPNGG